MTDVRRTSRLVAATLLLGACAADPPPVVPPGAGLQPPEHWHSELPDGSDADQIPDAWWRGFGDPQLDELVDRALVGNRDLRAALARLDAAVAAATIAGAGDELQADVGLNAQRTRRLFLGFPFGSGTEVPSNTVTTYGLSLNLSWEVDLWGRIRSGEAAALADVQAAAAEFAGAQLSLVAQTCKLWFAVVEARQQLDLAAATVAATQATENDVRDRFRRGVRPALDVWQATTNTKSAEANLLLRRDQLQSAIRSLQILVGDYPSGALDSGRQLPTALPAVPAGLPSQLLRRRPDLASAERRLAAAGCRVDAANAALYPRISLVASGGTQGLELQNLSDGDFRVWSLGANLLQPLLSGGALRAEVARNEAVAAEALANYGNSVLRAWFEVEVALAADRLLRERAAALNDAATAAASARDLARERWQIGITDFLAVADGQRQAFQAASAAITVERLRLDNRIDLFLALGGGFVAEPDNKMAHAAQKP